MNEKKIIEFLDERLNTVNKEEKAIYRRESFIYKIKTDKAKNEIRIQELYSIKNKRLVERNTVINGKLYGIREIYDEDGYIFLRGAYLEGKKIGLWHEYENGKIKIKISFDEKERFCGLYKEYYQNGQLKEESVYIKGELIKKIKEY